MEVKIVCLGGGAGGGTNFYSSVCNFTGAQGGHMALEYGEI